MVNRSVCFFFVFPGNFSRSSETSFQCAYENYVVIVSCKKRQRTSCDAIRRLNYSVTKEYKFGALRGDISSPCVSITKDYI